MGLFDKKYCDVCGEKIGLLGNRKLEDGNLCKDCAKKLSVWFDERRHSTVSQIKAQLEYREANRADAAAFRATRSYGEGYEKLYVDENSGKFTVSRGENFASDNPDILDFSKARGCELTIDEDRDEIKRTVDGRSESYNPPRYKYSYRFKVKIYVDHPYFDEMYFDLNGSSVDTGENRMGAGSGSWGMNRAGFGFTERGMDKYSELVRTGEEIKAMIDRWSNRGTDRPASAGVGQVPGIQFSVKKPIPYFEMINGSPVSYYLDIAGTVSVAVADQGKISIFGGLDGARTMMTAEIYMQLSEVLNYFNVSKHVSAPELTSRATEVAEELRGRLASKWASSYGVTATSLCFTRLALTDESAAMYQKLHGGAAAQTQGAVEWFCSYCGTRNAGGNFCSGCGAKRE